MISDTEVKQCTRCGKHKSLDAFHKQGMGQRPNCKECERDRKRAAYARMPDAKKKGVSRRSRDWHREHPGASRDIRLKSMYGVTEADVAQMYADQHGICPVCGKPLTWDEKNIDHNHETGRVRGLVHSYCNTGVGFLDNYRGRISEIMAYLGWNDGDRDHS